MRKRICKKTLKALFDGHFEAALAQFSRECCDSCPCRPEDNTECARDCMLGYLNYLSLTIRDEEFDKMVSSYVVWSVG